MPYSHGKPYPELHPHVTPDRPDLAKGEHNQEVLKDQPLNQHMVMVKPQARRRAPEYNKLYGTGRSEGDWRYFIDNYASGTFTTSAGTQVSATVTLQTGQAQPRLEQWPGAIHFYYVVRSFSCAARSAITTVGSVSVLYVDNAGQTIPLGNFESNANISGDTDKIVPTMITDPGLLSIGTLLVTLNGTTPTTSVYDFQIGFSYAYVAPSMEGYSREHQGTSAQAIS